MNLNDIGDKLEGLKNISEAFLKLNATEPFKALIPKMEGLFKKLVNVVEYIAKCSVSTLRARAALLEKNKEAFEKHLADSKQTLSKIENKDAQEELKEEIEKLTEKGDEFFGVDQLVMQANKV